MVLLQRGRRCFCIRFSCPLELHDEIPLGCPEEFHHVVPEDNSQSSCVCCWRMINEGGPVRLVELRGFSLSTSSSGCESMPRIVDLVCPRRRA